jgi:hypothetical protein
MFNRYIGVCQVNGKRGVWIDVSWGSWISGVLCISVCGTLECGSAGIGNMDHTAGCRVCGSYREAQGTGHRARRGSRGARHVVGRGSRGRGSLSKGSSSGFIRDKRRSERDERRYPPTFNIWIPSSHQESQEWRTSPGRDRGKSTPAAP